MAETVDFGNGKVWLADRVLKDYIFKLLCDRNVIEILEVMVILGAQWGDEGKGKIVDLLASEMDVVARCQGGNNAGHTVVANGRHYDFHSLPSGIIHERCTALIGNGVVLNLPALFDEVKHNKIDEIAGWEKRLKISDQAHLVFGFHMAVDGFQEDARKDTKIGTTKKGIGPTYSDKARRNGIRLCELMDDFAAFELKFRNLADFYKSQFSSLNFNVDEEVKNYKELATRLRDLNLVVDGVSFLHKVLNSSPSKQILVEGANGTLLDIDFGTYPYVTSSNCSVGGACTGLGIPPSVIGQVIGIVKAYQTRVGAGPFPTDMENNVIGPRLRDIGHEYGVTTGRPRRCGWLDLVMLKRSHMINGFTAFAVTKLDILDSFEELKVGIAYKLNGIILESPPNNSSLLEKIEVEYKTVPGWKCETKSVRKFEDLPTEAQEYIKLIESYTGVPVRWIGVGQDRAALIEKK